MRFETTIRPAASRGLSVTSGEGRGLSPLLAPLAAHWAYATALVLFVLGLLSKTVTATLPAALLVVFWWRRGRLSWRRDVLPLLPFFLLGAAAGALTAWVEYKLIGAEGAEFEFTLIERFLIAGRVIWFYLGKLLWPAQLIFIYPRWHISQAVWWQYLFPAAALLLLIGLWSMRRQTRAPLSGLLFFGGTLFPVLGLFNVYPFRYSLVADHFQYLASLGVISLVSAGVMLLLGRLKPWARLAGQALCLALLLVLAVLSWRQSRMYGDVETLYRETIARNSDCWMAYNGLGFLLAGLGRTDEAIQQYHESLRLKPECAEAHNNLGAALADVGRFQEAIEHYHEALRLRPDYLAARSNLGGALAEVGRCSQALEHCLEVLRRQPNYPAARYNYGNTLARLGRTEEAMRQYQEVLRLAPHYAAAHNNWGLLLAALGRADEAVEHYREALRLALHNAAAQNNLGNALARSGRTEEAIQCYREALRLKPDFAQAHNNLAAALARLGETEESIEHYLQALRFKPDYVDAYINLKSALAGIRESGAAIQQYNRVLQLRPDAVEILNNLAWLLATREPAQGGDAARAVQLAQRGRELGGQENAPCLDTLAAAYAAAGRFDDAVITAKEALQRAESSGQTALAGNIRARLERYREGQPYRETPNSSADTKP